MKYFQTDSRTLINPTEQEITDLYSNGFLFTRLEKNNLYQTRSLRIDLEKFELSSENRRILNKNPELNLNYLKLPLENYSWKIHSYAKDFYEKRFGANVMSANKIKELFQSEESNMNSILSYSGEITAWDLEIESNKVCGLCLIYSNTNLVHYAYPFYDLEVAKEKSIGLSMMTKAIVWAKENNLKYIYLGSVTDKKAHYKLQFEGLEWWNTDKKEWSSDISHLKLLTDI